MLLTTVDNKKSKYMAHMYSQALLACKLRAMIGYPSTHDFLQIFDCRLLPNCPITRADILAAEDILRPNALSLKEKTVQWTESHVSSLVTPLPPDILSLYHLVTLCMDIMFVNKMPFLVTISWNLKFGTTELLLYHQKHTMAKTLQPSCASMAHMAFSYRWFMLIVNLRPSMDAWQMLDLA